MKRMCNHSGFTLLEVLIVVLIAVLVTMFAVPAYKKSQDKNRYMAASGVLVDLANAIRMFKEDYPDVVVSSAYVVNNDGSSEDTPTSSNAVKWMLHNKYYNYIPFDVVNNKRQETFMRYRFAVSTTGNASCYSSCKGGVACMIDAGNLFVEYRCVWIDESGMLHNKPV